MTATESTKALGTSPRGTPGWPYESKARRSQHAAVYAEHGPGAVPAGRWSRLSYHPEPGPVRIPGALWARRPPRRRPARLGGGRRRERYDVWVRAWIVIDDGVSCVKEWWRLHREGFFSPCVDPLCARGRTPGRMIDTADRQPCKLKCSPLHFSDLSRIYRLTCHLY